MRASATSRSASPANYFASQAKADANKADNDSPFALLVASIASKDGAKPVAKDASQSNANPSKPPPDEDPSLQQGVADELPLDPVAPAPLPSKPEKSAKNKDSDTVKAITDEEEDIVLAPQPPLPTVTPPPEQPVIVLAAPLPLTPPASADDDGEDLPVAAAPPAAQAPADPAPLPSLPAAKNADLSGDGVQQPVKNANPPASQLKPSAPKIEQPAVTAQTPTTTAAPAIPDDAKDAQDEDVAEPAAPVVAQIAPAPKPAKTAAPAQLSTVADNTVGSDDKIEDTSAQAAHAKSRASANGIEHAAPHSAAAKTSLTNPGLHSGQVEAGVKTPKSRVIQADAGGTGETETEKSDTPASDTPKSAPQIDSQAIAANPKSAPQPAQAAIDAIATIAAPQAQSSPVATAAPHQHIQVTAQAAPDLPALAVEIAAKSQSGAKQFDIRLDPPELGRVEVRLSIDTSGKASAHLSADQPQTLSLLQKDAPILTRALREAGLDVSQNGLNFSLRQQGEQPGHANTSGRRSSGRSFALSASLTIDATANSASWRGPAPGRLDIRV